MLLTCGCSFVWGDELTGYDQDPPEQWPHTFTHKLGKYLNTPYDNLGACGNGNEKIFRDTLEYLSDPRMETPKYAVIIWSAWQRQEIFESDDDQSPYMRIDPRDNLTQFSPERIQQLNHKNYGGAHAFFSDVYDVRTDIIHGLTYMVAMQELCEGKGIKLLQGSFHERNLHVIGHTLRTQNNLYDQSKRYRERVSQLMSRLKPTSRIGLGQGPDLYTLAKELNDVKPYGHPGEQANTEFAKILYSKFENPENWKHQK